jgi:carotenoid cleavage dioxygenase-like enzyme
MRSSQRTKRLASHFVVAEQEWVPGQEYLKGNFAPVDDEYDALELNAGFGSIPDDLSGQFLRNGPNPRFNMLGESHTQQHPPLSVVRACKFLTQLPTCFY